jgi:predicted AAA+ superfamily ATPase
VPDLFPALRGIVDREPARRFLILGSAAPELLQQSSETLAGRISYYDLPPFRIDEVEKVAQDPNNDLWIRGGFPRSFLASNNESSF